MISKLRRHDWTYWFKVQIQGFCLCGSQKTELR
jgi:hypothetical protein